jgi:hypothetical protein
MFTYVHLISSCLICVGLQASVPGAFAQKSDQTASYPWAPAIRCNLHPQRSQGLHPDAYARLQEMAVAHRITQGINHSTAKGNVHDTDGTDNGDTYTGAVDISVGCLTQKQIKALLVCLANAGFAAWFRDDGQDGWSGPPHIHAVWAGCRLKPALQKQVKSWLDGRNGLRSDQPYQFWRASLEMKENVNSLYHAFN